MINPRYEYRYIHGSDHLGLMISVKQAELEGWERFGSPVWLDNQTIQQKMQRVVYE